MQVLSIGKRKRVYAIAFSPDGTELATVSGDRQLRVWHLATVSNDSTVRIWKTGTWQEHATVTWQIGALLNITFAPDGLRAAAGSDLGKVIIWDVE